MPTHLIHFMTYWILTYIGLVALYLLGGISISAWNRHLGTDKKIQSRSSSEQDIRRDFWQSLKSLITLAFLLSGGLYLQRIGFSLFPAIAITPLTIIIGFIGSLILFDTWFYWGHRLIHSKPFYRWIHAWHHQTVSPTVWSNNSDTLLDNLILQSYFFVAPLLLPIPSAVLVAHKIYDQLTGMVGHAGYEYSPGALSRFPSPLIGVTFHDQHHERCVYNYATHFSIWDRLMNTIHPDYDTTIQKFEK